MPWPPPAPDILFSAPTTPLLAGKITLHLHHRSRFPIRQRPTHPHPAKPDQIHPPHRRSRRPSSHPDTQPAPHLPHAPTRTHTPAPPLIAPTGGGQPTTSSPSTAKSRATILASALEKSLADALLRQPTVVILDIDSPGGLVEEARQNPQSPPPLQPPAPHHRPHRPGPLRRRHHHPLRPRNLRQARQPPSAPPSPSSLTSNSSSPKARRKNSSPPQRARRPLQRAEEGRHNPLLADAMIDPSYDLRIITIDGKPTVVEAPPLPGKTPLPPQRQNPHHDRPRSRRLRPRLRPSRKPRRPRQTTPPRPRKVRMHRPRRPPRRLHPQTRRTLQIRNRQNLHHPRQRPPHRRTRPTPPTASTSTSPPTTANPPHPHARPSRQPIHTNGNNTPSNPSSPLQSAEQDLQVTPSPSATAFDQQTTAESLSALLDKISDVRRLHLRQAHPRRRSRHPSPRTTHPHHPQPNSPAHPHRQRRLIPPRHLAHRSPNRPPSPGNDETQSRAARFLTTAPLNPARARQNPIPSSSPSSKPQDSIKNYVYMEAFTHWADTPPTSPPSPTSSSSPPASPANPNPQNRAT